MTLFLSDLTLDSLDTMTLDELSDLMLFGSITVSSSVEMAATGDSVYGTITLDTVDFDFSWGIEQGEYHWYVVESVGMYLDGSPIDDPSDFSEHTIKISCHVMARSVAEVCSKLIEQNFIYPVYSVKRIDPAARYEDWPPGETGETRTLVDVTTAFQESPTCFVFSLDEDVDISNTSIDMEVEEMPIAYTVNTSGSLFLSSSTTSSVSYNASTSFTGYINGILQLSGSNSAESPSWVCDLTGSLILGGSFSETRECDFAGDLSLDGVFGVILNDVTDYSLTTGSNIDAQLSYNYEVTSASELVPTTSNITTLCCEQNLIPEILIMKHNFGDCQGLSQFLSRNGFVLDENINLTYKSINYSWVKNVYYQGLALNSDNEQSWNLLFSLSCGNSASGSTLNGYDSYWKFSFDAKSKDLSTNKVTQTKLLLYFDKEAICSTNPTLKLDIEFNTSNFETNPTTAASLPPVFYDGIGLFKSSIWNSKPLLKVYISPTIEISSQTIIYPEIKVPIQKVRGGYRDTTLI